MKRYLNKALFWTYYFDIEHLAKDLGFSYEKSEKFFDEFVSDEKAVEEFLRLELVDGFEFRMKYDSEFIIYLYHPNQLYSTSSEYLDFSLGLPLGSYGSFTYLPALSLAEVDQLIATQVSANFNIEFLRLLLLPFIQDKNLNADYIHKALEHTRLFNSYQLEFLQDALLEMYGSNTLHHWVEDEHLGIIWRDNQSRQLSLRNPKTKIWKELDFEFCKRFWKAIYAIKLMPS